MSRRSPVLARATVVSPPVASADGWTAATAVRITEDEPVFAGHYPSFAIFPGVCVVDCVIDSAHAATPDGHGPLSLSDVHSARFVGAVLPGDRIDVALTWRPVADGLDCSATVATVRGPAATVKLGFRCEATA